MSITLSTGSVIAIASTYGAAVNMTAITNAAEAVATLAASHGVIVGDYLEITTSGWDLLASRVVRVKAVSTNDVTLEGISTTDTSKYPAGTGAGTIRRITAWTNVGQIKDVDTSGGELEFTDVSTITDRVRKQMPTVRSAMQTTLVLFDDPALAGQVAIQAANDASTPAGLRISYANGGKMVGNGYWSISPPNLKTGEALTNSVGISYVAETKRYAT